jgi:hypothetical protein
LISGFAAAVGLGQCASANQTTPIEASRIRKVAVFFIAVTSILTLTNA